ncbi:cell division protein ZipA [Teredinibacter franksiae]|uniref:cell division protein ZipA n=1 Tax=Teredinibacter franksiae TaxID=2761453 RepID=UPI0016286003|nr:cell division protein ZipA [Teredinibacter franksiae]
MRDWLTVIIVLLIVGILLDAFRRMRQSRRENLQLSRNVTKADKEEASISNSEFPSGGARVASRRADKDVSNLNLNIKKTYLEKKTTVGAPNRIPEQVTLNLDEHVPMLMDSVVDDGSENEDETVDEIESVNEPILGDFDSLDESIELDQPEPQPIGQKPALSSKSVERSAAQVKEEPQNIQQPDEVLIINVMARSGCRFPGDRLLSALMERGMKLGAMDIFHRHINDDGDGPVVFSLANMVVPGTFNLAKMNEFETPGVSLFLSLPLEITDEEGEPVDGICIRAYDNMAETSKALAEALDGVLMDKNRSVMKQQTIDYDRELVVEYERKQRLARV